MKKILQSEGKLFKKYLTNDNILKLVSLILATLLFFAVNGDGSSFAEYFSSSTTIEGVPLEVVYDDNYVVTGLPDEINVLISGPEANVSAAKRKQDTLKATLNIDINEEGAKTVEASQITFNSIGDVNVAPIVKEYDVDIQNKITKDMPIKVNYVNSEELTDGVMLEDPSLSKDIITVTGGSQDVSKIEEVKAIVDLSTINKAESNSVKIDAKLNAYDDSGLIVDNINLSETSITVTQKFTRNEVTLPINYTFTNTPSDQYVSLVCDQEDVKLCESSDGSSYKATVSVFGDRDTIDQLTNGVEYRINLANMNMNNNKVEATAVLPEGVYTKTPSQTVTVTLESGTTKTLKNIPINEQNLSNGLTAKVVDSSDAFIDVKITGAQSTIDNIKGTNVSITVDLDGYKAGDIATIPLQVQVADYVTAEPVKQSVEIEISEE